MIDIKKNPETVGKLKVGTSSATPADGELLVSGKTNVGDVEINGTTNVQLTDVANGGVNQVIMRHSRGTTASPTNSNANSDGNYISSQTYNSGYATTSQIGMVTGSAADSGKILFNTAASGGSPQTRLSIDSSGQSTFTRDGGLAITSNRTTDDGDAIHVRKDNYTRLRLGTLGITFPNGAGAAPTAAANNQLDYYGEGDWTPVFAGDSTAGTYTASSTATYTRIGNQVTVYCSLVNITETSAGSGSIKISGLPFASASGGQGYTGTSRVRQYSSAVGPFYALVSPTASYVNLMYYVNGSTDAPAPISGLSSGNTDITFTLTYFV